MQDKEGDLSVPRFARSWRMSLFWYVRRYGERTTTQGTSVPLRLRRLRQPLLSCPRSPLLQMHFRNWDMLEDSELRSIPRSQAGGRRRDETRRGGTTLQSERRVPGGSKPCSALPSPGKKEEEEKNSHWGWSAGGNFCNVLCLFATRLQPLCCAVLPRRRCRIVFWMSSF